MSVNIVNPEIGSFFAVMFLFTKDNNTLVFKPSDLEIEREFGDKGKNIYWGISQLSQVFVSDIAPGSTYDTNSNRDSLIIKLQHSGMSDTDQVAFRLASSVLLESFALEYMNSVKHSYSDYITTDQVQKVMDNCEILCSWLGDKPAYRNMLLSFRDIYVGLGYLRNQLSSYDIDPSGRKLRYI